MSNVTVKQLAEVVGTPVDRLLVQLTEAGLEKKSVDDPVSDDEKMRLLDFLRHSHGKQTIRKKGEQIMLKRRSVSELKLPGSGSSSGRTTGRAVSARGTSNKTVSVEVRQKRTYLKSDAASAAAQQRENRALAAEREALKREAEESRRAEEQARLEAAEAKRKEEEAARIKAEEERKQQEAEAALRKAQEAAAAAAKPQVATEPAPVNATAPQPAETQPKPAATKMPGVDQATIESEAAKSGKKSKRGKSSDHRDDRNKNRYNRQELHVDTTKSGRRKKTKHITPSADIERKHGFEKPTAPVIREIDIPETISVGELAQHMAIKAGELIKALMGMGIMATINQTLDQDTAILVVEELGHKPIAVNDTDEDTELNLEVQHEGEPEPRPPVVTIMGHVDHGKTSLLDYIRRSKVTAGEAGGITQHIGAYHVNTSKGVISFLDTPGHAAFTAMRARGAQVTDIVILIVAADDGVMPQTIEAIQHAKAAEVPIIVAINKIDRPEADPDRVKQELSQHEIIPEDWGGDTMFINISAVTGEGVDDLLESISLQAEIMELKAVNQGPAVGTIIESSLDKGRGPVATVLVRVGKLRKGDVILSGKEYGRVRALFDANGNPIDSAGPSIPAVILGLSGTPNAGDDLISAPDERTAREIAEARQTKLRDQKLSSQQAAKKDDIFNQLEDSGVASVTIMIKADVQGSAEALNEALSKLSHEEAKLNIISSSVGGISESDVNLAIASDAHIVAFNVRADATARKLMSERNVPVKYYNIIYEVIEDISKQLSGLLEPEIREEFIGLAEVRDVFKSSKFGAVAGCLVTEGVVKREQPIRVLRDNVVIYEGELESLRRFKDDVKEVRAGTECGIAVKNYNDVKPNDQIEVYERIERQRTL